MTHSITDADRTQLQHDLERVLWHYYERICHVAEDVRIGTFSIQLHMRGHMGGGFTLEWRVSLDSGYAADYDPKAPVLEQAFAEALHRQGYNAITRTKRITHAGDTEAE